MGVAAAVGGRAGRGAWACRSGARHGAGWEEGIEGAAIRRGCVVVCCWMLPGIGAAASGLLLAGELSLQCLTALCLSSPYGESKVHQYHPSPSDAS